MMACVSAVLVLELSMCMCSCVFQSSFGFYDISDDLGGITVKTVILDDLVMEFEMKVPTRG
jgi:hypothetical protein